MMKPVIILFLLMLLGSCESSNKEVELQNKIDSLQFEIQELKRANDTLSEHLFQKTFVTHYYPRYFDTIAEPENHLLEKLANSKQVPKDPVLGGTMRFTKVTFINEELLVASYEDGHVMGKAIYRYAMNREGELIFDLVETIQE